MYLAGVSEESEWEGVNECVEFVYDWYFLEWIGGDASDGIKDWEEEEEGEGGRKSVHETDCYKYTSDNETLPDGDTVFGFAICQYFWEEDQIHDGDKYPEGLEWDAILGEIIREWVVIYNILFLSFSETIAEINLLIFFSDNTDYLAQVFRERSYNLVQNIHRRNTGEKRVGNIGISHKELYSEKDDDENVKEEEYHRKWIKSRGDKIEEIEEGEHRRESRSGRGNDIFVPLRDDHPEKRYVRQEKHHPVGLSSVLIPERFGFPSKREDITDFLGFSSFLRIIDSWENKESESSKETKTYESVYGDVDNRDIMEKELTEEIWVDNVWYKEHSVSFRRIFCMILYERIGKIRIFPGKKKHPSEEKISNSRVISDFAWEHKKQDITDIYEQYSILFVFLQKKSPSTEINGDFSQSLRNYPWAFLLRSRYTWRTIAFSRSFRLEISRVA